MPKMNKTQLLNLIALNYKGSITTDTIEKVLVATYQSILNNFELDNDVTFEGFGTFHPYIVEAHDKVVPFMDDKLVYIPTQKKVSFSPHAWFGKAMNENDYQVIQKAKSGRKKTKTKAQIRKDYNEKRRKQKPTTEDIVTQALNKANGRKKR